MGDIVGRLFREFAVTLSVTILISAVVSLTLTPMMCSKLLRHKSQGQQGALYRASERWFQWVIDRYALRAAGGAAASDGHSVRRAGDAGPDPVHVYRRAQGLFPGAGYRTSSWASPRRPRRLPFAGMADRQQALARVILQDPDVVSLSSFIGVDGTNMTPNSGRIQINLKPREERTSDASRHHPPAAGQALKRRGHHAVHAGGAGPQRGRSRQPHAVSVQPGGRRSPTTWPPGCRDWCRSCKPCRSSQTWPPTSRTVRCKRISSWTATRLRGWA